MEELICRQTRRQRIGKSGSGKPQRPWSTQYCTLLAHWTATKPGTPIRTCWSDTCPAHASTTSPRLAREWRVATTRTSSCQTFLPTTTTTHDRARHTHTHTDQKGQTEGWGQVSGVDFVECRWNSSAEMIKRPRRNWARRRRRGKISEEGSKIFKPELHLDCYDLNRLFPSLNDQRAISGRSIQTKNNPAPSNTTKPSPWKPKMVSNYKPSKRTNRTTIWKETKRSRELPARRWWVQWIACQKL